MKTIYQFSITKVTEVEKREERGEETIISKEKVEKPVNILIKSPSRRERGEMDTIEAIAFSKSVQSGIMTRAMMQKAYRDSGGLYTKEEQKEIDKIYSDYENLQRKLSEGKNLEKNSGDLMEELMSLYLQIKSIENKELSIFETCAENKAKDQKVQWALVNLTYLDESEGADGAVPTLCFGDGSYEEKLSKLDEYFEKEDPFFIELWNKASIVVAYWVVNNMESSEEEIDSFFKEFSGEEEEKEEDTPEKKEPKKTTTKKTAKKTTPKKSASKD